MAYEDKVTLDCEDAVTLGGTNDAGKPNPTSIEGYFLGNRTTPDKGYGEGTLHIFKTATGNLGVWGKTNTKRLLTSEHVGQMCLLTFTGMGEKKKGKNPAYLYKLQFDRTNTIDPSSIEAASAGTEPDYDADMGETDVDADDAATYVSDPAPARAVAPKAAVKTPSAEQQAKVRAALASRRTA